MNMTEKYCTHCKKNRIQPEGMLHGHLEKLQGRSQKLNSNKKLQEHNTALVKRKKKQNENSDSSVTDIQ